METKKYLKKSIIKKNIIREIDRRSHYVSRKSVESTGKGFSTFFYY